MLLLKLIFLVALVPTLTNADFVEKLRRKLALNSPKMDARSWFRSKISNSSLLLTKTNDGALLLTKYIENGYTEKARQLSRCRKLPNVPRTFESYSGFITVRKKYNSNMFFWFFPAANKNVSAPVILWLQGGPGNPGLLGLFMEHGPYIIQANLTAKLREYHWARTFNMIYVDNPVGAGFSFTENYEGYVTSQEEMADDMYEFLRQFFILFHEYKNNDFYIAGQSYGGKWVPSVAHKIHSMGTSAIVKLTGIMVGNGYCHPETMVRYSEYLHNIGLLDEKQAKAIKELEDLLVENIKEEKFSMELFFLEHDIFVLIDKFTGFNYIYNFLLAEEPEDFSYYEDYVKLPQFKKAVHVGNKPFKTFREAGVFWHLLGDAYRSVKPSVTVIMNNYKVLFYTGQLDIIVPYPTVLNFLKSIDWKHAEEYRDADRKIWYLKNSTEIAGYVHKVGDFYEVMVRNAGHEVPYDKPEEAYDLITRFVYNEPYF